MYFVEWDQHPITVPPVSITPHTYPLPLHLAVGACPSQRSKANMSTSEDVPMHSLAYRLPRTPLLGTWVHIGGTRSSPGRGSDVNVALMALVVAHEDQRLSTGEDSERELRLIASRVAQGDEREVLVGVQPHGGGWATHCVRDVDADKMRVS